MDSNLFKKTAQKILIEQNNKTILYDNDNEKRGFNKLEQFMCNTYVMTSQSFTAYLSGQRSRKRLIIVCIIKINAILFVLRYMVAIVWNTSQSRMITSNANHMLGNGPLLSCVLALGHLVGVLEGVLIQYLDVTHTFTPIHYLCDIQNQVIDNLLNDRYRYKFYQ
jgi:hypothetical protein